MIQETGVDTWPVVLKVNLHSLGVAFLIFFSHFSPIFGPFQEEKYVSRNYVENDLWTAIAWEYVSYFNNVKEGIHQEIE